MNERLYWPAEWADEIMPPGKPSPDAFLVACAGPKWKLGYAAGEKMNDEETCQFAQPVAVGDVVEFIWSEDRGEATVQFSPDGSYRMVEGVEPGDYDCVRIAFDNDTINDSLAKLAAALSDSYDFADPQLVQFARWNEPEPYRLESTANGPRFIALASGRA
jgi:hypothetical protein